MNFNNPEIAHREDHNDGPLGQYMTHTWQGKVMAYFPSDLCMVWVQQDPTSSEFWQVGAWIVEIDQRSCSKMVAAESTTDFWKALTLAWRVALAVRAIRTPEHFTEVCQYVFDMHTAPMPAGLVLPFALPASVKQVHQEQA